MKRLFAIFLGLAMLTSTVALTFAQDEPKQEEKTKKRGKGKKKKKKDGDSTQSGGNQ
ncbi:MAG: hypothetical protein R2762_20055 [Bryobacteraceae bacterium]